MSLLRYHYKISIVNTVRLIHQYTKLFSTQFIFTKKYMSMYLLLN